MLKAFVKDSYIYYIPTFISRGLGIILLPLYTRVLNPADYGSFDLLIIFSAIINLTIALEISQGVARFYSFEKNFNLKIIYASTAFWFTFFCYLIFSVLMWSFSSTFSPLIMGQSDMESNFKIGIGYIFINGIFNIIQNQLRFELRSKQNSINSIIMIIVTASISVWLTVIKDYGLTGLLIGMVSGVFISLITGLWSLRKSFRFCFGFKQLNEMLVFSSPLVISGVAVWLTLYIDRLMINHFLTIDEVGIYGIGYRLASVAIIAISGIELSLTPLIYKNYKKSRSPEELDKIFRFVIFFSLTMFMFLTFFSSDILKIITVPAYYSASSVVVFLIPALLFRSLYIFFPGISIAKKNYLTIWINIIGGIINFLLNFWFIPLFGSTGAAIATLLSYLLIFFAYVSISQSYYFIPYQWNKIFISVVIALLFILFFQIIKQPDIIRLFTSFLILLLFFFISIRIQIINFRDILNILKYLKKYS